MESLKLISRNKSRTHPVNIGFQIERTIEIPDYLNFASNLNMKAQLTLMFNKLNVTVLR